MNVMLSTVRDDDMARVPTREDDTPADAVWQGIRTSQEDAARALHRLEIHTSECNGRYLLIEQKLNILLWVCGGFVTSCGGIVLAWLTKLLLGK